MAPLILPWRRGVANVFTRLRPPIQPVAVGDERDCSPTELAARIGAVLRRRDATEPSQPYVLGDLAIDYAEQRVTRCRPPRPADRQRVPDASRAFDLRRAGADLRAPAETGRGLEGDANVRPMRTVIGSLRRKLGDDAEMLTYIFAELRVGYRMAKSDKPEQVTP